MKAWYTGVRWVATLIAAAVVMACTLIGTTLVVTVYALYLGFQARGAPDQELISQFAAQVAPWLTPTLQVLFTVATAAVVARKSRANPGVQGLLVGIFTALFGILFPVVFGGRPDLLDAGIFILVSGAGWLGGFLVRAAPSREAAA